MTKAERGRLEMKAMELTGMAAVYAEYREWKMLEAAILAALIEAAEQHTATRSVQ